MHRPPFIPPQGDMFRPPFPGAPLPGPPPPLPPPGWLPPGWSEHKAPDGTPYFYNAASGQSSWVRPVMPPPPGGGSPGMFMPPPPQPGMAGPHPPGMPMMPPPPSPQGGQGPAGGPILSAPPEDASQAPLVDKGKKTGKAKKEKAIKKTQILETPWFIVVTNLDNTFFYNKETKTSLWVPTPELEKALVQMGEAETEKLRRMAEEEEEKARQRRAQEEAEAQGTEMTEDDVAWQLAMMEQGGDQNEQDEEEDESSDDEQMKERLRQLQGLGPSSGSSAGTTRAITVSSMAAKYSTQEEKEQAYMAMLRERGVTQFDTWNKVLERTEGDARMLLISDKKVRQDLFENYCVIRSKEVEEEKRKKENALASSSKDGSQGKGDGESESKPSRPEDVYKRLMEEYTTVNSTWLDFYTKYRTDQRFLGLKPGSLREALFRQYLSDLKKGKIKPKAAGSEKKASSSSSSNRDRSSGSRDRKYKATKDEMDEFKSLLKEIRKDILYDQKKYGKVEWRSLKKLIDRDRRYDAVGSSTEREWIFEDYAEKVIKGKD